MASILVKISLTFLMRGRDEGPRGPGIYFLNSRHPKSPSNLNQSSPKGYSALGKLPGKKKATDSKSLSKLISTLIR